MCQLTLLVICRYTEDYTVAYSKKVSERIGIAERRRQNAVVCNARSLRSRRRIVFLVIRRWRT